VCHHAQFVFFEIRFCWFFLILAWNHHPPISAFM
jgi:hypothetical protein